MGLKNDWTIAHFLYYIFRFSSLLLMVYIFLAFIPFVTSDSERSVVTILPIPAVVEFVDLEEITNIELGESSVRLRPTMNTMLSIKASVDNNYWAFVFYNGLQVFRWTAIILTLFYASQLFKNIALGDPFNYKNPKILFVIGWILFFTSILFIALNFLPLPLLNSIGQGTGFKVHSLFYNHNNFLLIGIISFVLGYVFKEANRIHEEQKLTV